MEFKHIKELVTLINSTEIMELEIENDGFRLAIRKEGKGPAFAPVQVVETMVTKPMAAQASPEAATEPVITQRGPRLVEIEAPMVGTFYRAPAPDAPPYIQVGDTISEGQVLYIIEAMKMMNEIEAEISGVVKEILVENGQPVEYGQPLLLVAPRV